MKKTRPKLVESFKNSHPRILDPAIQRLIKKVPPPKNWARFARKWREVHPDCEVCKRWAIMNDNSFVPREAEAVDHIFPRIFGGHNKHDGKNNLQSICWNCHSAKTFIEVKPYSLDRESGEMVCKIRAKREYFKQIVIFYGDHARAILEVYRQLQHLEPPEPPSERIRKLLDRDGAVFYTPKPIRHYRTRG